MTRPGLSDDRRRPAMSRLDPGLPGYERILNCHDEAMARGSDTYVDPLSGLTVFTASYLWERGSCCQTGCRHCPYVDRP